MLTATVRNLERDGMLTRHVYAEVPPRVEYELTALGKELMDPVRKLVYWLQSHWPVIQRARDQFDARARRVAPASTAGRSGAVALICGCHAKYLSTTGNP
jgi:DNA-binding PadR family transcriptional regulator